jgi:hypothetical protein
MSSRSNDDDDDDRYWHDAKMCWECEEWNVYFVIKICCLQHQYHNDIKHSHMYLSLPHK